LAGFVNFIGFFTPFNKFIRGYKGFFVSLEDIKTVVEDGSLPVAIAEKYLKLYVANIDWQPHIINLWKNASSKFSNQDLAKDHMKKAIACATILPLLEKTPIPDPPSNLLFWCTGWRQFNEQNWFELFQEVIKEDILINENRKKIISVGIIDPIDIPPMARQAYNWLHERSMQEAGSQPDSYVKDIESKMANLVRAYGGALICNMFINHKLNIDKVMNWRSGYFFEKQIHKVYSLNQIIKIKTAELQKTNQKYIKKIGVNNG